MNKYRAILLAASLFFAACDQQQHTVTTADNTAKAIVPKQITSTDIALDCTVTEHHDTSLPQSITLDKSQSGIKQVGPASVILTVNKFISPAYPGLRTTADSAMHIASVLLNSQEFKDSINRLTFTCRNFRINCAKNCATCDSRFKGSVVLDSTYRQRNVAIDLYLDNKNAGSFGSAAMNVYRITSHYPVIRNDDKSLPFSYSYAYHIGHEYMHIVGFTHQKNKDDVAYRVGVTGYRIIRRWHKAGINPMAVPL